MCYAETYIGLMEFTYQFSVSRPRVLKTPAWKFHYLEKAKKFHYFKEFEFHIHFAQPVMKHGHL